MKISKVELENKIKDLNVKLILKIARDLSIINISKSFDGDLDFIGIGFFEEKGLSAIIWIRLNDDFYEYYINRNIEDYIIHHQFKNVLNKVLMLKTSSLSEKSLISIGEVIKNLI